MSHAAPATDPAKVYRKNLILNATPEKLVLMMYDGALQALERAKIEIQTPGRERSNIAGEQLGKAISIIGELRASLDLEQGAEVAANLDRLYEFILDRIYMANIERSSDTLDSAVQIMRTLKEGWDGIIPA
ncbi:MAG: flagellar export chaperone FliS [Planctomycetota bacterium]|nr:MAG: flagellar export chaperone FliS [Planctomycetota bacterium]